MMEIQDTKIVPVNCGIDSAVKVEKLGRCTRSSWEAYSLFGSGKYDELKSFAKKQIEKNSQNEESFTILIGIARIEGDQKNFEEIAIDYAMQFGRSPPAWFSGHDKKEEVVDNSITFAVDSFSTDTIIEIVIKLENPRDLTIDLGTVTRIDAAGIEIFQDALKSRLDRGEKTRMIRGDGLIKQFAAKLIPMKGKPIANLWEFCFSYYRINGKKELFDELAGEYAKLSGEFPKWKDLSERKVELVDARSYGDLKTPKNLHEVNEQLAIKFLSSNEGKEACASKMITIDMADTTSGSLQDAMEMSAFIQTLKKTGSHINMVNINEIVAEMLETLGLTSFVDGINFPGQL